MWSVVEKTALAEAEVEYQDYTSDAITVKFPVAKHDAAHTKSVIERLYDLVALVASESHPGQSVDKTDFHAAQSLDDASVVIWTTTPWTIPGNRAISYSNRIEYSLVKVTEAPEGNWLGVGEKLIIATSSSRR